MIPVGAPVMAWTRAQGALRGVVRGSQAHASGARLYLVTLAGDERHIWEIEERFVFDVSRIVRTPAQFSREFGTS